MARSKTGGGIGTNQHAIKGASRVTDLTGPHRAAALDDIPQPRRRGQLSEADLAAKNLDDARRRHAAAEHDLAAATQALRAAEQADMRARAGEITAAYEAARANVRELTANYWAMRATTKTRPGATVESLQPRLDATTAIFQAGRAVSDLAPQVMAANGWRYDDPRLGRDDDEYNDWGRPSLTGTDEHAIQSYLRIIHAAPDRKFPELWEAIDQIEQRGYGDAQGMPCPYCLTPMYSYNDDNYYCRSCR